MPPPTIAELLEHQEFVQQLARSLLTHDADADDLVQETWLTAMRRGPRHSGALRAWLKRLVRHTFANRVEAERSRADHTLRSAEPAERENRLPEREVAKEETKRAVQEALEGLSAKYRDLLVMRFFEGLPASEIAERTGLPLNTVRTRLRRGVEALRTKLDRRFGGERGAWERGLFAWAGAFPKQAGLASGGAAFWIAGTVLVMGSVLAVLSVRGGPEEDATTAPKLTTSEVGRRPELRPSTDRTTPIATSSAATRKLASLQLTLDREAGDEILESVVVTLEQMDRWGVFRVSDRRFRVDRATGWDDLEPGTWRVRARGARDETVQLVAGETRHLRVAMRAAITVQGAVIGANGETVPGAEIWISPGDHPGDLQLVGTSNAAGAFEVRGFDQNSWIGARIEGMPYLIQVYLDEARSKPEDGVDVDLHLVACPLEVTGRVVDEAGHGVQGARVTVITLETPPRFQTGRIMRREATPIESGPKGEFRLRMLCPDWKGLRVEAPGFAPAFVKHRAASSVLELSVQLQAAASATGVVTGPDGAALAGATVEAKWDPLDWERRTTTDKDGHYTLTGLPAGRLNLRAWSRAGPSAVGIEERRVAEGGEVLRWDPALEKDFGVHGYARSARGQVLAGWVVTAAPPGHEPTDVENMWRFEQALERTTTDAEGAFILPVADGSWNIALFDPEAQGESHRARSSDVSPPATLDLVRDPESDHATVRGRLVAHDGQALQGEILASAPGSTWLRRNTPDPTGAFRFEGVPAGTLILKWFAGDVPPETLVELELTRAEFRDLGLLTPPARGSLLVSFTGDDVVERVRRVTLDGAWGQFHRIPEADGGLDSRSFADLPAGDYTLYVAGPGVNSPRYPIVILPGEESLQQLELEARLACVLWFHWSEGFDTPYELTLQQDPDRIIVERSVAPGSEPFRTYLEPGGYSMMLRFDDGREEVLGFWIDEEELENRSFDILVDATGAELRE